MRKSVILFLKKHPNVLAFFWNVASHVLRLFSFFVLQDRKTMLFCAFGGRKFDDSPKAIYDEICSRDEFKDWRLIWAFDNPRIFDIPRGEKVKIDSLKFFKFLLKSKVWVSNSGMTRGIRFKKKGVVSVETWHGTPLKRIGGEELKNSMLSNNYPKPKFDNTTIRCAQSEYDRDIFARIWNSDKKCFLLCDLPRNDTLLKYTTNRIEKVKEILNIDPDKKVILYTPTYREYLVNEHQKTFLEPPINLDKWEHKLGGRYVLLIRAHYAVSASLSIKDNSFVKDVSSYPILNDLYAISDMMISDYSSTFFDYSILNRPMFCFAYDRIEYEENRGLYLNLDNDLPCSVDMDEDSLIDHILTVNYEEACNRSKEFHKKYAPYAGNASKAVVDEILKKLQN